MKAIFTFSPLKTRTVLLAFITFLSFGCSSPPPSPMTPQEGKEPLKDAQVQPVANEIVRPPWQLWLSAPTDTPLGAADSLDAQGRFEEAVGSFLHIENTSAPGRLREEAFSRRVGILLKQGQSRRALEEITQHLRIENVAQDKISPILAMLAAYAYIHLGDHDQALAWFGTVLRRADRSSVVGRRSEDEARLVIAAIPRDKFASANQTWATDQLFAPFFAEEDRRRGTGGAPTENSFTKWFQPRTYGAAETKQLVETDLGTTSLGPVPIPQSAVIGVLLPETGKYADFASRIRQGIELSLHDSGHADQIQLAFADSTTDPVRAEQEYERLCREKGVAIVVGPMLAKVTEQVAKKSEQLQVPLLSFTKKPGVTGLSKVSFRLGATAENQTMELLDYVTRRLSVSKVASLIPRDGTNGEEFGAAFRASAGSAKVELVGETAYASTDAGSIRDAVEKLEHSGAQAIFLAEGLETALPVIEALRRSPLRGAILMGPATWNDPVAARGYGALLEGAVIATPFFLGGAQPQVTAFVTRYRQTYGQDPELLAAQAYDATSLIISSLEKTASGAADFREKFISSLRSVDNTDGVTGKLSVRQDGEILRRMSVLRMHNGELLEVLRGGSVTGFVPDETQAEKPEA